MKVEIFKEILKNNNALFLNEDYIIFNDFELFNRNTMEAVKNNNIEELLNNKIMIKQ